MVIIVHLHRVFSKDDFYFLWITQTTHQAVAVYFVLKMAAIPIDPMDKIDKFVDKFIEFQDDEESIFGELKLKKETLTEFSHLLSPQTIAEEIRNAPQTIQNKTKQV